MAWIQSDPSGNYHVSFRYGSKKFKRSPKTKSEKEALARKFRIEETIKLLEMGRLELPELVDVPTYLMPDGKLASKPELTNAPLEKMFELYFDSIPEDGLESNTLKMIEIHQRHLVRLFGKQFNLRQIRIPKSLDDAIADWIYQSRKRGQPITKRRLTIDALTHYLGTKMND